MNFTQKPIKQMSQEEKRAYWRESAKRRKDRFSPLPSCPLPLTVQPQAQDPVAEYRKDFQPIRIVTNGLDLSLKLSPESIQEILALVSQNTLRCYTMGISEKSELARVATRAIELCQEKSHELQPV